MKHQKKNYMGIFVSVFLALIMVTSIMGYIFGDRQDSVVRQKGIKFTLTQQGWRADLGGSRYFFSFLPDDLENINLTDINIAGTLEVDVTYDFNSTFRESIAQSIFELSSILSNKGIFVRQGFTTNTPYNVPIITCSSATQFIPVLYFTGSNQTAITKKGNCIYIESQSASSFLALTDKVAYSALGIV